MRERSERFEAAMKRPQGVLANNVLDLEDRLRETRRALKSVLDMETNRYACASERNAVFSAARRVFNDC